MSGEKASKKMTSGIDVNIKRPIVEMDTELF